MDLSLVGKRALVTGASSGLGLGCAQALATEGAIVTMVARSEERLAAAAATIRELVHIQTGDLSHLDGIGELVAQAEQAMGGIDILIANAGGPPAGNFASITMDQYDSAIRTNLLATIASALVPRRSASTFSAYETDELGKNRAARTSPVASTKSPGSPMTLQSSQIRCQKSSSSITDQACNVDASMTCGLACATRRRNASICVAATRSAVGVHNGSTQRILDLPLYVKTVGF